MKSDKARHVRVRAVVAYPAVTVALVVSIALALTPFGSAQVMALDAASTPTETSGPSPTPTAAPIPTATDVPSATTTTAATSSPAPTLVAVPTSGPTVMPGPASIPTGSSTDVVEPGQVPVDHHVLGQVEGPSFEARYLPVDGPATDASQFQTLRVRFKIHNAKTLPITASPQLEYRTEGSDGYLAVPERAQQGSPFHIVREWVPSLSLAGGTMQGPPSEDIAVAAFRTGDEGGGLAMTGHHSMGANPDRPITLPTASYTEQEWTVRLTMDAAYLTGYQLRITDAGTALAGTQVATIRLGPPPKLRLSPGQQNGLSVGGPKTTSTAKGAALILRKQATAAPATSVPSAASVAPSSASSFPAALAAPSTAISSAAAAAPAAPAVAGLTVSGPTRKPLGTSTLGAANVASSDIHGPYSMNTTACGICHRSHTAEAPKLLNKSSQSGLCLTCHDGLGAGANVQAEYGLVRPANNPVTREYYSHDAPAAGTHTQTALDGSSSPDARNSECSDCHNPHKARTAPDSNQTETGWDASGRLAGVSGVSVVNGAAGSAPTYTVLDGVTDLITREYQLCFRCHSGSTKLPPSIAGKPSKDLLDKAVELNPANPSFHPVEAAGTNDTDAMKASLAGTSPYKLWNFDVSSTIRCSNCHAGRTPGTPTTPLPLPGSALAPHASSNRGILLSNYQDRVLTTAGDAYSAGNFALCYTCHAEEPFVSDTGNATNFSLHGKHVSDLDDEGDGGTDIDKAGDGQGNAVCAECHFRLHSTTNKVGTQKVPGTRLLNFAPNVEPLGGTISWTQGTTGSGSCTLTCHGYEHEGESYSPPAGPPAAAAH